MGRRSLSEALTPQDRALANMKYKDLKLACVARGMPFEEVIAADHPKLASWFYKNFDNGEDPTLLSEFDVYVEDQLQKRGYKKGDAVLAPCFRLGFVPPMNELPDQPKKVGIVVKMETKPEEPKAKREVDQETGIIAGTKKSLTYKCQKDGKTLDETVKIVKEKFPDAQDKSIKIWFQRSAKASKE
jgi:hypothetical protein